MLPNDVATTFCAQHEDRLAWIGLQERVLSWLHGIHDPEPQTFIRRPSKDKKRHHYSPYPLQREPPRAPSPIFSRPSHVTTLMESDFPPSASEIISPLWHVRENVEFRTTSLVEFKVADDLPDPELNPLITLFATDIEEEYCRLLFLCKKLEADRTEAHVRWKRDLSHAAMREFLDIEISIQRVLQSAQYVIDYTYHCNLNVDFQSLFLQHYCHPFRQPSPENSAFQGTSYCAESTPQNRDVRDQEISEFDCQGFTSLDSDTNIWVFE